MNSSECNSAEAEQPAVSGKTPARRETLLGRRRVGLRAPAAPEVIIHG